MTRLFFNLICTAGLASLIGFAQDGRAQNYDMCYGEAQAIMQRHGGENLTLVTAFNGGWDINGPRGHSSYSYQRGTARCSISFDVISWYGGLKCSEVYWASGCYEPGKRPRRR